MGRGKGGIGFGSSPKRIKTSEYEWKANENIFTIAYCNTGDCENLISYVPVAEVHPVLAHVVRNMNQKRRRTSSQQRDWKRKVQAGITADRGRK